MAGALAQAGDEWSAVLYFYAAYHEVKAALIDDPVFDELDTCLAVRSDLQPEDRFTSRHQGRRHSASKEWGINELVLLLYPTVAGTYNRLHTMSIDVRYHQGLRGTHDDVLIVWDKFRSLCDSGALATRSPSV